MVSMCVTWMQLHAKVLGKGIFPLHQSP